MLIAGTHLEHSRAVACSYGHGIANIAVLQLLEGCHSRKPLKLVLLCALIVLLRSKRSMHEALRYTLLQLILVYEAARYLYKVFCSEVFEDQRV